MFFCVLMVPARGAVRKVNRPGLLLVTYFVPAHNLEQGDKAVLPKNKERGNHLGGRDYRHGLDMVSQVMLRRLHMSVSEQVGYWELQGIMSGRNCRDGTVSTFS